MSRLENAHLRAIERFRSIPGRRWLAIALGLLAGFGTWSTVEAARTSRHQWGDVLPVLVATENLAPGSELSAQNTELRAWPVALVPPGALTDDRPGRVMGSSASLGQVIVAAQTDFDRHGLESQNRSITLPHPLAQPPLRVGDSVDLIAVTATQSAGQARLIAVAQVREVDDGGITVVVDQHQTAAVFEALSIGSVEFARRPAQR